MNPIEYAFEANVGHSEKLVLVYLAHQANGAGYGVWQREAMEQRLGYKKRSMQRILKALKDAGVLEEAGGDWYRLPVSLLSEARAEPPEVEAVPAPAREKQLHADEIIGQLQDDLLNTEARIRSDVNRVGWNVHQLGVMVEDLGKTPDNAPPPDPVRESEEYQTLIKLGIEPSLAYDTAQKRLEDGLPEQTGPAVQAITNGSGKPAEDMPVFSDDAAGRLGRILYLLTGERAHTVGGETLQRWQALEDHENRFTVQGEVDAFELLYPAIVAAARDFDGSVEAFLDPEKIKACRAPWDMDPNPGRMEDPELEADIGRMIAELNATGDKRFELQGRNTDVAPDGTPLIETIEAYHRRVSRMYDQMQHMKATGAI